jgi:hypothetical protein
MNKLKWFSVLLCFLLSSVSYGQAEALSLQQALDRLDVAIDQSQTASSGNEVREAAAVLSFVLERDGLLSAAGELALGNAYFIGNDLGRAVLHYRRGLVIDPGNETLLENLEHARSFVEPTVPGEGQEFSVRSLLLSWHRFIDRWLLWYGTVGVFVAGSVLLVGRFVWGGIPLKLPIGLAAVGLIGAVLLGFDQWVVEQDDGVVVVMPGTGMYSGPGAGVYSEVYDGPLGAGTEGELVDLRDGWANIRLSNSQEGWVTLDSLERVVLAN